MPSGWTNIGEWNHNGHRYSAREYYFQDDKWIQLAKLNGAYVEISRIELPADIALEVANAILANSLFSE
jgi:hypothetical protein